MSLRPSVTWTSISSSPFSMLIARMPTERGLPNSDSRVFFTTPCLVAKRRYWSSENSRTGTRDARRSRRLRDLVHLEPVALPLLGEEHHVVVGGGDEQVLDPVVFLRMGGDHAAPAAPLAPVGRHGQPLDVARVGHGDHHVLFRDQVFDRELALIGDDLGASLVAEAVRQLRELLLENLEAPGLRPEDFLALLDELADFPELLLELGDFEGGEARQPHVEDFRRLLF